MSYKLIMYAMNPESGYFEKSASQPETFQVSGMPFKFKRQKVWDQKIKCNADECLQITDKKIFTGLQPIGRGTWFIGDLLSWNKGKSTKSLLIIHTSETNDFVLIAIFRNFFKLTHSMRAEFAKQMIPEIWGSYKQFIQYKNASQTSL